MILNINGLLSFLVKYDRGEIEEIEFPNDIKETLDYLDIKLSKHILGCNGMQLHYDVSCLRHNLQVASNNLWYISERRSDCGDTRFFINHDKVFFCDYIDGYATQNGKEKHLNLECLLTNNLNKFLKTH